MDTEYRDEAPQQLMPAGSSLAILLLVFGGVGLAAITSIVLSPPEDRDGDKNARVAHGPREFPQILGEDFTKGLDPASKKDFQVPPPPFSEGIYPCMECHEQLPPDPTVRKVDADHHPAEIHHGDRWCLDCHDEKDRNSLHLANGTLVPFEESYRLCGQCHGDKYRDWKEGIHGKRTGWWNGTKRYMLCANCHNPHSPRFKPLTPLPPPIKPAFQKGKE